MSHLPLAIWPISSNDFLIVLEREGFGANPSVIGNGRCRCGTKSDMHRSYRMGMVVDHGLDRAHIPDFGDDDQRGGPVFTIMNWYQIRG